MAVGHISGGGDLRGNISGGGDLRGNISGGGDLRGNISIKHGVDGLGVPKPSQGDAGKIPFVNEEGYGYELRNLEPGYHVDLKGRDEANQHPMSAITGLENALDGKQPTGNYLTSETDPTVPDWAKQPTKPAYAAEEVGADTAGTAQKLVTEHNANTEAHNDIRIILKELVQKVTTLLDSDDTTLDQMSEVVAYIKSNREVIESITTSKVNVTDIIDNLETNLSNKTLSAACGVRLKAMIDAIVIPTKVSAFENDAGYLTEHQDISGKVNESELEGKVKGILTTEEWTFELEDGSIVTKKVVII